VVRKSLPAAPRLRAIKSTVLSRLLASASGSWRLN